MNFSNNKNQRFWNQIEYEEIILDEEQQEILIKEYHKEDERLNGNFKTFVSILFMMLSLISFFEFALNPLHLVIFFDDLLNFTLLWKRTDTVETNVPYYIRNAQKNYTYLKLLTCILCYINFKLFPILDGQWTWAWFLLPATKWGITLMIHSILTSLKKDIHTLENAKYKLKGA